LTIKKGDSGSAGLLEEKCVMNQAPKLVTKIDQKLVINIKINKKVSKFIKTEKQEKPENKKK